MTDEKWQQLVEMAQQNFDDVKVSSEDLIVDSEDGPQVRGTQDILRFKNQAGRFEIVRENRAVLLNKKEHFSHRAGDTARTEYTFSETETSHKIKVYKEIGFDDWQEVTLDGLGL